MKKVKMYLLFASLIGLTVACQKTEDILSENTSAQDVTPASGNQSNDATLRHVDPDDFVTGVNNPFFPLTPGDTYHSLTTKIDGNDTVFENHNFIITHQTKVVQGVTCIEVHDVSTINGVLLEDTYDWFAQDDDGNVWYFGEDTKKYDSTGNYSTAGSWEAGVNGAQAGIQMWAHPRLHIGQTYNQEYYVGIAEDKAKVINGNVNTTVPYGSFQNCIKIREWTPLEPGIFGFKIYKAGIGQVRSGTPSEGESAVLISITH